MPRTIKTVIKFKQNTQQWLGAAAKTKHNSATKKKTLNKLIRDDFTFYSFIIITNYFV